MDHLNVERRVAVLRFYDIIWFLCQTSLRYPFISRIEAVRSIQFCWAALCFGRRCIRVQSSRVSSICSIFALRSSAIVSFILLCRHFSIPFCAAHIIAMEACKWLMHFLWFNQRNKDTFVWILCWPVLVFMISALIHWWIWRWGENGQMKKCSI